MRLCPDQHRRALGLCEGIETGARRHDGLPGACRLGGASASGISSRCQLPPEVRRDRHSRRSRCIWRRPQAAERLRAIVCAPRAGASAIALPPRPTTTSTMCLQREGASAARTMLAAATEFLRRSRLLLSASIIDTPARCTIEDTKKLYPLPPSGEPLRFEYRRRERRIGPALQARRQGQAWPGPLGDGRDSVRSGRAPALHGSRRGVRLRVHVEAMDARVRAVDFDRASLARVGASEIKGALFAAGLRTESDGDSLAVQILKAADPDDEILVVSRPGWHRVDGTRLSAVRDARRRSISDDDARLELATAARFGRSARGSLDGWKAAVAAAAKCEGCPHFLLGVLAGFAGVVQSLAGLDSCGINLSGLSSSGKTTAQRLAVSAWTSPSIGAGLLQSMRSTENAVEVFAQAASGTVLALDELAHADGRAVARLIYAIAGGQGKARLTAGAMLKQRYAWSTYAVLSSECSLEEKVRADGASWIAGMAVRIVDVDVTDVDRTVPADLHARRSAVSRSTTDMPARPSSRG